MPAVLTLPPYSLDIPIIVPWLDPRLVYSSPLPSHQACIYLRVVPTLPYPSFVLTGTDKFDFPSRLSDFYSTTIRAPTQPHLHEPPPLATCYYLPYPLRGCLPPDFLLPLPIALVVLFLVSITPSWGLLPPAPVIASALVICMGWDWLDLPHTPAPVAPLPCLCHAFYHLPQAIIPIPYPDPIL